MISVSEALSQVSTYSGRWQIWGYCTGTFPLLFYLNYTGYLLACLTHNLHVSATSKPAYYATLPIGHCIIQCTLPVCLSVLCQLLNQKRNTIQCLNFQERLPTIYSTTPKLLLFKIQVTDIVWRPCSDYRPDIVKEKVKKGHTPKERRRGAHLAFIGRWARRWINHCCLRRMASATPDLRLPSHLGWYSLCLPTEGWPGWVDLGDWLHNEIVYPPEDSHPSRH